MTRDQDIRKEVLFQLFAAGIGLALDPARIARVANRNGLDMTPKEAREACLFYVDAKQAAPVQMPDGAVFYRITRDGVLAWEGMQQ